MGLNMNQAVGGLINEASSTDASHIDASVVNVLHVEAFYTKWQHNCTVCKIFNNYILFAFVITRGSHDIAITRDIPY